MRVDVGSVCPWHKCSYVAYIWRSWESCGSWFFPTTRVLKVELTLLGLVTSTFTCKANLPHAYTCLKTHKNTHTHTYLLKYN